MLGYQTLGPQRRGWKDTSVCSIMIESCMIKTTNLTKYDKGYSVICSGVKPVRQTRRPRVYQKKWETKLARCYDVLWNSHVWWFRTDGGCLYKYKACILSLPLTRNRYKCKYMYSIVTCTVMERLLNSLTVLNTMPISLGNPNMRPDTLTW